MAEDPPHEPEQALPPRQRRRQEAHRQTIQRRRAVALGVVASLVLLVLLVVGGDSDDEGAGPGEEELAALTDGLSDEQLAGQRVIAGFDGTSIPAGLRTQIREGRIAGLILFEDNLSGGDAAQRQLLETLQSIPRPAGLESPLLLMVDEEGGQVTRTGAALPAASEVGSQGAGAVRAQGEETGRRLAELGFNVNLAPVLDVPRPGGAIDREQRGFATDPEGVAELGVAYAEGLRSTGIAATGKHFPGLGSARVNTDDAAQRIRSDRQELEATDLPPFKAFSDAGGELVMFSLAVYPELDDRPAGFSAAVTDGLLREQIGFSGVSISDALDAEAARAFGDSQRVALTAARVGVDLLLYPDWREAREASRILVRRLRAGGLRREPFERSVGRVLALRDSLAPPPAPE